MAYRKLSGIYILALLSNGTEDHFGEDEEILYRYGTVF
jgi:predicted alpha/beta-hydrolase family hydrolase